MAGLRVLHLVTAKEVFFRQQIEVLEEKGVECDVCVVPGGEQIDGAMANKRGLKEYLQYIPKVRRYLRRGEYDLIHANYGLTAPYAITQFRLPVVLTLWGSDVIGFDGIVTKACAWRCDAVTVRSEEMKDILGREDAHIVPSGVDTKLFRPIDQEEAREQVGWDADGTYVLFPYSPEYKRKNYPLAEKVISLTSERLGTQIKLRTISGVSHEKMPFYMNAADILILTSRHEGSPNTVKEAIACGVPVVSTNVGDTRKWLTQIPQSTVGTTTEDLVSGLADAIRIDERPNSTHIAKQLSWESVGETIVEIYENVLRI